MNGVAFDFGLDRLVFHRVTLDFRLNRLESDRIAFSEFRVDRLELSRAFGELRVDWFNVHGPRVEPTVHYWNWRIASDFVASSFDTEPAGR